ncbi:ATP-binding cassette domain-containing protein [Pseudoalteromonas rubra]|uniref:ATP-binding cassette domain-containing protein n=1 Tax=Pseudoalteromonas rubra TaxID=43658 RepID=UPI000F782379|nr:ATP-binding cassette domain-containing protein [Pseudoalteromonas rubra]
MIQVEGLQKRFKLSKEHSKNKTSQDARERDGYFHSVESVSFQCQQAEVLGLLGPNGAGKTTTLRMLSTALTPDSGAILVGGQDIVKNPLFGRRCIGFLSGTTGLYGRLTAKENVEYFARLHGLKGKALKARCELLFETLDMIAFLDKRSDSLSTGMKQKTNIARAVVHQPQVVILDEPTTGLDIMTKQTVLTFIRQLKEQGTPVIFSTHHLDEVDMLCDKVCVIDKGISCFEGDLDAFRTLGRNNELNQAFMTIIRETQDV